MSAVVGVAVMLALAVGAFVVLYGAVAMRKQSGGDGDGDG